MYYDGGVGPGKKLTNMSAIRRCRPFLRYRCRIIFVLGKKRSGPSNICSGHNICFWHKFICLVLFRLFYMCTILLHIIREKQYSFTYIFCFVVAYISLSNLFKHIVIIYPFIIVIKLHSRNILF